MSTDWEQHYQEGHTPWDKGSASPPLIEWLAKNPGKLTGEILVPGCGFGHDIRAIAAAEKQASILGVDISPKAIELAKAIPSASSEKYIEDNLFTMPHQQAEQPAFAQSIQQSEMITRKQSTTY